jgi:hypothetical protein
MIFMFREFLQLVFIYKKPAQWYDQEDEKEIINYSKKKPEEPQFIASLFGCRVTVNVPKGNMARNCGLNIEQEFQTII